jgi:hypothetical protein
MSFKRMEREGGDGPSLNLWTAAKTAPAHRFAPQLCANAWENPADKIEVCPGQALTPRAQPRGRAGTADPDPLRR